MLKDMFRMHEEHVHEDNMIAMETCNQMHTKSRAQLRSAINAATSHILETDDLYNNADSTLDVCNVIESGDVTRY